MEYLKTFGDFINESKESEYKEMILEHVNEMSSAKDIKRINDIISKSGGNEGKAKQLALKMANSMKNKQKGLGRYEAALELLGEEHPVTIIFADKAKELGNDIEAIKNKPKKKTLGKLGSKSPSTKNMGTDKPYTRGSKYYKGVPILPLGKTNLRTGKCKYFNIYDTWGENDETTIELWQSLENDSYKLVFTSGAGPICKIGTTTEFIHDQNSKYLFAGRLIDWANIGDADLLVKQYNVKSANGYTYK